MSPEDTALEWARQRVRKQRALCEPRGAGGALSKPRGGCGSGPERVVPSPHSRGHLDTDTPIPNAGVHFPPPLLYVGVFITGWLCDRLWPLRMTFGTFAVRVMIASLFLLVWLGMMVWALATFRAAKTTLVPNQPATALATNGPYRVTRNPMYVSLAALYVGAAFLVGSWWPLLLLPVVLWVVQHFVIAREERYLASAFPVDYPAYCQRVRRWI